MSEQHRIMPWWLGYLLINPLRRLQVNPEKTLAPYIKTGMNILDYGPGMGFFSLPMARMVGEQGKVYCIDIQKQMLDQLVKRATKHHLDQRIVPLLAGKNFYPEQLNESIDFALLSAVVHEVSEPMELFTQLQIMLRKGAIALIAEPRGHVSAENFNTTMKISIKAGFKIRKTGLIQGVHSALIVK